MKIKEFIKCPICNKDYKKKLVEFTLTLDEERKWIMACPWCFEKTIRSETEEEKEDRNMGEVFKSYSSRK